MVSKEMIYIENLLAMPLDIKSLKILMSKKDKIRKSSTDIRWEIVHY